MIEPSDPSTQAFPLNSYMVSHVLGGRGGFFGMFLLFSKWLLSRLPIFMLPHFQSTMENLNKKYVAML